MIRGLEFAGGRINASSAGSGTDVWYYTRDHLGSTRLITDANGAVKERSDYYPFGARMYDPCLGRWTTQDPLAEKYPGISPYAYCADNPVNPGGRDGGFTCKVPCVKYKFNYVMQIDLG